MAKNKRNKQYIRPKYANPIAIKQEIETMRKEIQKDRDSLKAFLESLDKSNSTHITLLSNFAQHDIKNSVQSIDSIVSANSIEELTKEHIQNIKHHLNLIRKTIENFSKLVPYDKKDYFNFDTLITTIESLNRETFHSNKILFTKDIPEGEFNFNLPFQSVVQMINNIIINAVKAFTPCIQDKKIKLLSSYDENNFYIKIFDNASNIPFDNIDSIFDFGVSSTGGSGIGLFHARYLCGLYKGSIEVCQLEDDKEFNKYFFITLPIIK